MDEGRLGRPATGQGVLDPDDSELCVDLGVQGVIVSNHGGQQLGGAPATLEALPAIVDRVRDRADVLFDGGIRSGRDVVFSLALGAKACLVGRPLTYALAGGGTAGARDVLRILGDELTRNLKLMGFVRNLDRAVLLPRSSGAPLVLTILPGGRSRGRPAGLKAAANLPAPDAPRSRVQCQSRAAGGSVPQTQVHQAAAVKSLLFQGQAVGDFCAHCDGEGCGPPGRKRHGMRSRREPLIRTLPLRLCGL
jgi:hypothetical protein